MVWLVAAALAGPLDEALETIEQEKATRAEDGLALVRARTHPPSALPDIRTAEAQVELVLRWGATKSQRDCQRFEEMREVLRRSNHQIRRAPELVAPVGPSARLDRIRAGKSEDPMDDALEARVREITGAEWSGRAPWTSEKWIFQDTDNFVNSMTHQALHCPPETLLQLRDEVVEAGIGHLSAITWKPAQPGDLTVADEIEVEWAELQAQRPDGSIVRAEAMMVDLLERRGSSERAVRAAQRVQSRISKVRASWNACSGHHCSDVLPILVAARKGDGTVLALGSPVCAALVTTAAAPPVSEPLDRLVSERSASDSAMKGALGQLAHDLYAMGCVKGVPARFEDLEVLRAHVSALPADCPPPSSGTTTTSGGEATRLLARARAAVLAGCAPAPWAGPP